MAATWAGSGVLFAWRRRYEAQEKWTCIDMCSLRFLEDEESLAAEGRMAERVEI